MNKLNDFITKNNRILTVILFFVFILFNTLKITVFNMIITDSSDLSVFIYKLSLTFLLLTGTYLLIFKIKFRFAFITFYLLQVLYTFIYLIYFIYFHSYLHISQILALVTEGLGAAADLSILISPILLVIILDLPLFIYTIIKYPKIRSAFNTGFRFKSLIMILSCLIIIVSVESWNYFNKSSIVAFAENYNAKVETQIVQRYGTLANSLLNVALNSNDISMAKKIKYGKQVISDGKKAAKKPNIIIIQVESMDSNILNAQHNGKYVMPYLQSLSQKSVYYPYAMSYHMAGATSDSEFSIINSVEPLSDFPSIELVNYNYPNSIVKQLLNASYSTTVYHGNYGYYFNRNVAFPKMGFEEYADIKAMSLKFVGWGARDEDVFSYVKKRYKTEKKPFFAYIITMSSHGPFTNASLYYETTDYDDVKNAVGKRYFTSMSYVDQTLKDYVEYIQKTYDDTYVFIWGDHTPCVNTDEYKQASFVDGNNYFEFVPLIILTPDKKVYKENKIVASFLDFGLTIANASNIPYKLKTDGIDLLNRGQDNNKIPYKETLQDRSYLFSKVSQVK